MESDKNSIADIEKYVIFIYGQENQWVNEMRYKAFSSPVSGTLSRELAPSRKSLELYVMRSSYQSDWV